MLTMKNGTHSAMQSTSASARAVEISIAQLLPVQSNFTCKLHVQAAVLAASSSWATASRGWGMPINEWPVTID
jgi:hypothetical protein